MTFLNVVEIESAVIGLATAYPTATQLITLPHVTVEGRWSHALRIGSGACPNTGILLVSGTHAREWGGPDILINFAADLLEAWSAGTGLVYGGTSFSANDVGSIVRNIELIVFPNINPDGRHHSQTSFAMHRKNRNPASGGGSNYGIDLNRNYDFLWNFPVAFHPNAVNAGTLASNNPGSDLFHGTGPFSEAETKNVRWLFDNYRTIRRFIDLHSYGGLILHPWGDDTNQTTNPNKSFKDPAWNGHRGIDGGSYAEYIDSGDLADLQSVGNVTRAAIAGVRGESYTVAQSFYLPGWTTYPTSGASDDWAFSRRYSNVAQRRVLGFVFEFNKTHTFFPSWSEMEQIIRDVDAGLVAFCRNAVPKFSILSLWCLFKDWFFVAWRRLFPWEIWGPYGPWGKIRNLRSIGRGPRDDIAGRGSG